jgi:hypothetical protein
MIMTKLSAHLAMPAPGCIRAHRMRLGFDIEPPYHRHGLPPTAGQRQGIGVNFCRCHSFAKAD